ncbi:hypothetical protein MMPV_000051 [Pyropia vietnamensis]
MDSDSPAPPSHLFVYGTLRPAYARMAGSSAAMTPPTALHEAGRHLGEATLDGYALIHLGAYPAITAAPPPSRVIGDVYALPTPPPPELLATLDAYEGIEPDLPHPHEYTREAAVVTLTGNGGGDGSRGGGDGTGESVRVWIYTYAWPTHGGELVPGGDWLAWVAARAAKGGGPEAAPRGLRYLGGGEGDATGAGGVGEG